MPKLIDHDHESWEPNPLIDVEIPTLMLSKKDMIKFFAVGLFIGTIIMSMLYYWLW